MWVGFWFNTETFFITDMLNNDRWKERNLFCKTVVALSKIGLYLKDRLLFMRIGEIETGFLRLILMINL